MLVDKLAETILTGENVGFFLGIPITGENITGTSGEFMVKNPPIFPRSCNSLSVKPEDVTVTSDSDGSTVTVTGIIEDDEGRAVGFETDGSETTVTASYVEELEPFLAQGVTVDIKQDTKEVSILNNAAKLTAYAGMTITIKSDQILSANGLEQFRKLMFYEESSETSESVYRLMDKPLNLYGYMTFHVADETLGRIYFENVKMSPSLPAAKAGDNLTFDLEMTVAETPKLILPKE